MFSLRNRLFSVMTWNIYQGADFAPIFAPGDIEKHVAGVYRQFLATNFLKRAKAIARQIILEKPDIIGLQEAVLVELVPPNSHCVLYDFADILINELSNWGMKYSVAAQNYGNLAELPSTLGNKVRYRDRNVILIRDKMVKVVKKEEANFLENLTVPLNGQPFTILRGWCAIDVCVHGHVLRIVNTHLEPLNTSVQVAQGNELLNGPGNTALPLIFIGDFNSNANGAGATYENLIAAGFEDTWSVNNHSEGFTAHQDADLLNPYSSLNERIDLILTKNIDKWKVLYEKLVGEAKFDRTFSRLWPSDHAGIIAKFKL